MDKPDEYKKLDPSGVFESLELFPEQVKESWKQAYAHDLPLVKPTGVLISGMGGSSNAAKILEGVYEEDFSVPIDIDVHNDYGLPSWVGKDSLFIANSYSGNTEETLSGYEEAKKRGATAIGISTGGKLNDVAIDVKDTNPTGFPKTGLGISIGALAGVLAKVGVLNIGENEINGASDEIVEIRKSWNAKEMAEWFHTSMPILFGGRPLIGALNAGRNALCEISRNFTQFYDFPEVNHVLIEALQKPEHAKHNKYLFFESEFNHERVLKRYEITKNILTEMGLEHKTFKLKGKTKLAQALELAHFSAWVGFYISMLDGTDPGPEPWILKLKSSLSQPVH